MIDETDNRPCHRETTSNRLVRKPLDKAVAIYYIICVGMNPTTVGCFRLELSSLWCAWEWDDVADVLHTGDKEDEALEAEAEASMWA